MRRNVVSVRQVAQLSRGDAFLRFPHASDSLFQAPRPSNIRSRQENLMKHPLALLFLSFFVVAQTAVAQQFLVVTPPQVVLHKTQNVQMHAYWYESTGIADDVTNSAAWTSVQPSIATVSSTGLVTMKGAGSALIVATYQNTPGYGTVWSKFTPFIRVPPQTTSTVK